MFKLYECTSFNMTASLIEQFDSVREAIMGAIGGWHESDPETRQNFVLDESGRTVAVFMPKGKNQVTVLTTDETIVFTGIEYVRDANGKLVTKYHENDSEDRYCY
jgi:hypothetical protein